jgi:hypothetical protein
MEEDEKRENQFSEDPFTKMMFGSRAVDTNNDHNPKQDSSIDYEELMNSIDQLFESAKSLKPYFQKFYPMIEQLWKKK